jgi:hypothetical protein
MVLRCPVCRAENSQGPTCRRCKADLTLLFALEQRRAALIARARSHLEAARWEEARRAALWADHLRQDEEAKQLLALAALGRGDFREALRLHRQTLGAPQTGGG